MVLCGKSNCSFCRFLRSKASTERGGVAAERSHIRKMTLNAATEGLGLDVCWEKTNPSVTRTAQSLTIFTQHLRAPPPLSVEAFPRVFVVSIFFLISQSPIIL